MSGVSVGAVVALVGLVIVVVLCVTGQMVLWPLGALLLLAFLARLV